MGNTNLLSIKALGDLRTFPPWRGVCCLNVFVRARFNASDLMLVVVQAISALTFGSHSNPTRHTNAEAFTSQLRARGMLHILTDFLKSADTRLHPFVIEPLRNMCYFGVQISRELLDLLTLDHWQSLIRIVTKGSHSDREKVVSFLSLFTSQHGNPVRLPPLPDLVQPNNCLHGLPCFAVAYHILPCLTTVNSSLAVIRHRMTSFIRACKHGLSRFRV